MKTDSEMYRRLQTDLHQTSKSEPEYILKTSNLKKWDLKWRGEYRIVHIECDRHYLHNENQITGETRSCNVNYIVYEPTVSQAVECRYPICRKGKFLNLPMNLPTITLHDNKKISP